MAHCLLIVNHTPLSEIFRLIWRNAQHTSKRVKLLVGPKSFCGSCRLDAALASVLLLNTSCIFSLDKYIEQFLLCLSCSFLTVISD